MFQREVCNQSGEYTYDIGGKILRKDWQVT